MTETLEWEAIWRPNYPLASDDLTNGAFREPRAKALTRRYIEANPQALTNLLIIDIDAPDALLRASWCENYRPNWVTENPINGHAHALWLLERPIPRTDMAHYKPIAYAHAITEGLRLSVDGDKGYSGLLTKNPQHAFWSTYQLHNQPYTLNQLKTALTRDNCMPAPSWRTTKRRAVTGLGRNCTIFESARLWAYREVRNHFGNPESLAQAVMAYVHHLNAEFPEPLPDKEACQIAESITGWIVRESQLWQDGPVVYEATFTAIQSARGRKGGPKSARQKNQAQVKKNRSKILEALNG